MEDNSFELVLILTLLRSSLSFPRSFLGDCILLGFRILGRARACGAKQIEMAAISKSDEAANLHCNFFNFNFAGFEMRLRKGFFQPFNFRHVSLHLNVILITQSSLLRRRYKPMSVLAVVLHFGPRILEIYILGNSFYYYLFNIKNIVLM